EEVQARLPDGDDAGIRGERGELRGQVGRAVFGFVGMEAGAGPNEGVALGQRQRRVAGSEVGPDSEQAMHTSGLGALNHGRAIRGKSGCIKVYVRIYRQPSRLTERYSRQQSMLPQRSPALVERL